jgi:phenylacetate-CoA ligase
MELNSSYQAFYGIPMDFIGNKKERFKDFEPSVSISIFDLSDAI